MLPPFIIGRQYLPFGGQNLQTLTKFYHKHMLNPPQCVFSKYHLIMNSTKNQLNNIYG